MREYQFSNTPRLRE